VVADTGPLQYLVLIGQIDLIPALFETVFVPSEVKDELSQAETPPEVRSWIANPPAWITAVSSPNPTDTTDPVMVRLDRGERAAIIFAASPKVDVILMDDRAGVAAAKAKGLKVLRSRRRHFWTKGHFLSADRDLPGLGSMQVVGRSTTFGRDDLQRSPLARAVFPDGPAINYLSRLEFDSF
jgi:predicted nucleic acid-binding protein